MNLLPLHIAAGSIAIIAGAVALFARKGARLHRRSGIVFVLAMLVMTASAVTMAAFFRPNRVNVVAGLLTFYLVCTSMLTVRRTVDQSRTLIAGFMLLALGDAYYAFSMGLEGMHNANGLIDKVPPQPLLMFATVGLLGGLLDARLLLAGSIQGAHRIARHLWRMTFAMWIATASFFLGQSKFFPVAMRKSGVLAIPVLLVLLMLIYWLARTLFTKRFKHAGFAASPRAVADSSSPI